MLPRVSMACDPQQTTYSPLLMVHQSAKQDSLAEQPMLDSESQTTYDLDESL